MKVTWRQGAQQARGYERMKICEAERYTTGVHVQTVVRRLCSSSPLGLCDCSDLKAACRLRRWARVGGTVYVEFKCSSSAEPGSRTYKWCLGDLRPGRKWAEST